MAPPPPPDVTLLVAPESAMLGLITLSVDAMSESILLSLLLNPTSADSSPTGCTC